MRNYKPLWSQQATFVGTGKTGTAQGLSSRVPEQGLSLFLLMRAPLEVYDMRAQDEAARDPNSDPDFCKEEFRKAAGQP